MPRLNCMRCGGEGRIYTTHHGGNDPDTIDAGECYSCRGSGNQKCEAHGCNEDATVFNDDGDALCEDCMFEWMTDHAHEY